MNVNSDEVIYTMMITSLEDKIKTIKEIVEVQKNLINKLIVQFEKNTSELAKYRDKYGEL
jgi:septation ring formation regulator EzrA